MRKEELVTQLQDIEWEEFEVKEAKHEIPKSSWETVSAFSNTAGGWLVFGVRKKGKLYDITGVTQPEKIEQDFTTVLRGNKFNKKIAVTCKKYQFPEGTVLAFKIPQRSKRDKPIYYDNTRNTFIRTASGDQRATQEEIDTFYRSASFEEKDGEKTTFTIKHFDPETIKRYRTYFASVNPGHRYIALSDEEFLERVGAITDGKAMYGGLLVFGTEIALANAFTSYRLDYLEIPGTTYDDGPTRYTLRLTSEKNLFLTFFDIYEQLSKRVDIPFSVKGGFRDDDPPQLQAIREALVNLLIHTDYFSQASPRIRVFTDRYEFYNPGGLPKAIEFILKEDFSLPRNPVVAKLFRFIKLSENIGSGFSKMISGWQKHYHVKPLIASDFDFYTITFPTTTTTKSTTKTTTKQNTEQQVLSVLRDNPHLTAEDVAKQVGISKEGIRYHIKNLKKKGILGREGGTKNGRWVMKK